MDENFFTRKFPKLLYPTSQYRALSTSPYEGFAGTMLVHHPHKDTTNYGDRDKAFRDQCCGIGFDVYCDKFFEERIVNNCEGYSSPAVGMFKSS